MATADEFSFIAQQLEWLETYLRAQPRAEDAAHLESALNALVCARAVIAQLAVIGQEDSSGAVPMPESGA